MEAGLNRSLLDTCLQSVSRRPDLQVSSLRMILSERNSVS